jgi:hypothetical protein
MPRKPQKLILKKADEEWIIAYYLHGYKGQGRRALMAGYNESLQAYPWEEAQKELLPEWIREHPCTRPFVWWKHSAPEPRRRVGGTGRRPEDPLFNFGLPACSWIGVDINDPPKFESEAAFLIRHGLLTSQEKQWLEDHPEALEPVTLEEIRIEPNPFVRPMYHECPKWVR